MRETAYDTGFALSVIIPPGCIGYGLQMSGTMNNGDPTATQSITFSVNEMIAGYQTFVYLGEPVEFFLSWAGPIYPEDQIAPLFGSSGGTGSLFVCSFSIDCELSGYPAGFGG